MNTYRHTHLPLSVIVIALLLPVASPAAQASIISTAPELTALSPPTCQGNTEDPLFERHRRDITLLVDYQENALIAYSDDDRHLPMIHWQVPATTDPLNTVHNSFAELANPTSKPQRVLIQWCDPSCFARDVLVFGGGYDPDYDTTPTPPTHSRGNAVYIVDTFTGQLIWSAGGGDNHHVNLSSMRHSIVAEVSAIDRDKDCYVDTLFAIDIQGGIFRFDLKQPGTGSGPFASGGHIADIGGGGRLFRRFFNAVDVAYFQSANRDAFFTLSVASGDHRHRAADQVLNYLFVLIDPHVITTPDSYHYVSDDQIITPQHLSLADTEPQSAHGWYLPLEGAGEKALAPTLMIDRRLFLITHLPVTTPTASQDFSLEARAYVLDALLGTTLLFENQPGEITLADFVADQDKSVNANALTFYALGRGAAASIDPQSHSITDCSHNCGGNTFTPLFAEHAGTLKLCSAGGCLPVDIEVPLHKTYWRKNP